MSRWSRVFGASSTPPEPSALLECVRGLGISAIGDFQADTQGWFLVELEPTGLPSIRVERFLAAEEGIRQELNSWAAWVESVEDRAIHGLLMHHIVSTTQLFTCEIPAVSAGPEQIDMVCAGVCQFLARQTGGVYQIDGQGFYSADGKLLVAEP